MHISLATKFLFMLPTIDLWLRIDCICSLFAEIRFISMKFDALILLINCCILQTFRFIYCERANITLSNVSSLLYTSKKYMLMQLSTSCMQFLEQNLSLENVCAILDQSLLYDEVELTNKCLQFIGPNAQAIFQQDTFLTLSSTAITRIAQHDFLYLDSEATLYNACIHWAKEQIQHNGQFGQEPSDDDIRKTLGDIIYRIRFPNMEAVEFAKTVGQRKVLSFEEKSKLYYYILMCEVPEEKSCMEFDQGMRVQICSRFPSIGSAQQWWSCNGPTDAVSFQTDCDIQIIGIALYGGKEKARHDVSIEIRDSTGEISSEPLVKMTGINLDSDGSVTPCAIYLPAAVVVKSDRLYTVLVTMKGPLTHYGTSGREKLSCTGVTIQFFSSNKSTNGTNVKSGQIPHIIFRKI